MRYLFLILLLPGCAALAPKPHDYVLKYDYFDKSWSYQPQDSRLMWNYMESRYEWAK